MEKKRATEDMLEGKSLVEKLSAEKLSALSVEELSVEELSIGEKPSEKEQSNRT